MSAETITFMFVLAQIAGIFIGFGALISVSKNLAATEKEAGDLAAIVYIGIMVVVGALIPILLDRYGLNPDLSFKVGAIVFLLMAWGAAIANRAAIFDAIKTKPVGAIFFWTQEALVQIPLFLILAGTFSHLTEAFYLTALVISTFEAAQMLVGLVFAKSEVEVE